MASSNGDCECPKCGSKDAAFYNDTQTFEDTLYCPDCFYSEGQLPVYDWEKRQEDPDHKEWYALGADRSRIMQRYSSTGDGDYYLNTTATFGYERKLRRPVKVLKEKFKRKILHSGHCVSKGKDYVFKVIEIEGIGLYAFVDNAAAGGSLVMYPLATCDDKMYTCEYFIRGSDMPKKSAVSCAIPDRPLSTDPF